MAARLILVALRITSAGAAVAVLVSGVWLMATPQSDQPLLDAFEDVAGLGPAYFLSPTERATYQGAIADFPWDWVFCEDPGGGVSWPTNLYPGPGDFAATWAS